MCEFVCLVFFLGDTITLDVTRTPSSHGTVSVDWAIQGVGGINPATGFQVYQGSLQFLPVCQAIFFCNFLKYGLFNDYIQGGTSMCYMKRSDMQFYRLMYIASVYTC